MLYTKLTELQEKLDKLCEDNDLEYSFSDELTLRSFGDFVIDDDQLNKIKNMAKKIHYLYLQLFFYKQKQIEKNQWNTGRNQVENQQISTDNQQIETENKQEDTEETADTEQMDDRKVEIA